MSCGAPRSESWPRDAFHSLPVERPLLPDIDVADGEEADEDEHLAEEEHPGAAPAALSIDDGPGVEEGRLDIEQDEQHGDLVETDVEPLTVQIKERHTTLIRRELGGITLV